MTELRNLRNEIEDNFPACPVVTAPWKEDRKRSVDSANDSESELDLPPIQKRPRLQSDSISEGNHSGRSMNKEVTSPESSDPFTTPTKKSNDSEWTGSTQEESDSDQSSIKEHPQRRVQVPFSLYNKIKEMFYPSGPRQVYIDEKNGEQSIVRRALKWDGGVIHSLPVTDSGRFFIKYDEREPGVVVEFYPTINNRSVNIHGGKLRCAALVYRTFVRTEPSLPLVQYQFKAKDGNALNFSVDNIIINTLATAATRKPRNNYQKYKVSER